MSYNGSGTFQINSAGQPVVTGTVISSTAFNALTADLATGLSTAITKDGQTTPTANIKLGGFKLTNVGTPTTAGDALIFGSGTNSSTLAVPTRQVLTSGTTYTTPANVRQLRIRMVGGGGGGGGSGTISGTPGTVAGAGGNTTFGTALLVANGGGGAGNFVSSTNAGDGGSGGTASLGSGPVGMALTGGSGTAGGQTLAATGLNGMPGAASCFGGGGGGGKPAAAGTAAAANTGAGGGGAGVGASSFSGAGGGAGGCIDAIINTPLATYTYTVGAAGSAGAAGTSGYTGGAGASGIIIVDEFY